MPKHLPLSAIITLATGRHQLLFVGLDPTATLRPLESNVYPLPVYSRKKAPAELLAWL